MQPYDITRPQWFNSLRPRWNRHHLADDSFTMYWFRSEFHWSLFPKGPIKNIPALVHRMAWRRPSDKPLSEPMMIISLMHIWLSLGLNELTHCCLNILLTFSNAFCWIDLSHFDFWILLKFVPKGSTDKKSTLVDAMDGQWLGNKPLPEQIQSSSLVS